MKKGNHNEENQDIIPKEYPFGKFEWFFNIPVKIYNVLIMLTAPLRAIVWILDGIVSALVVLIAAILYGWWTHRIPDSDVSWFMNELGTRLISILHNAGIF